MTDWRFRAKCRALAPVVADRLFWPKRGDSAVPGKAFCHGWDGSPACPVRSECLVAGLSEEFGVWGGTGIRERQRIKREGRISEPLVDIKPLREVLRRIALDYPSIAAMSRHLAAELGGAQRTYENLITHSDRRTTSLNRARQICTALGCPDLPDELWPEAKNVAA